MGACESLHYFLSKSTTSYGYRRNPCKDFDVKKIYQNYRISEQLDRNLSPCLIQLFFIIFVQTK